jgi:single-strand DNA-binding protein
MLGVNKVILVGTLGKNPEIKYLESGKTIATLSIATNEAYRNKNGEKVTNTEWHKVVFWSPIAEIIEKHLGKGSQVYIEGKLQTKSYVDKEGVTKYSLMILGQELTMLAGGNKQTNAASIEASGRLQATDRDVVNYSIPAPLSNPSSSFDLASFNGNEKAQYDLPF